MNKILPCLFLFLAMLSLAISANNSENEFVAENSASTILFNNSENPLLTGNLKNHVEVLASDSLEGRGLGTRGKVLAKNYIAEHFRSFGLNTIDGDYFQRFEFRVGLAWVQGANVIGYIEGTDPDLQSEFIVIGAHYDHLGYEYQNGERIIYPGADDNASGTALLIELARYFSQNPELLGRSIIFIAFDAEESGLIGSQKFVNQSHVFDMQNIKAMFSLDMVGMYEAFSGLSMKGMGSVEGGVDLAEKLALEYRINLKNTSAEIEYRTDTRPFGDIGIPAIHASTGMESPYHKPEDTHDQLDYEGMAGITRYLKALIAAMSLEPELNLSNRFAAIQSPFALRFNAGILAHAGSSHHIYADEFFRADNVFAFSTGMFLQLHIGRRFSLQPEILYDFNGSKSVEGTFRRHSFMVPVNLHLNLVNEGGGLIRLYSVTGGYYRYNISGKDGENSLDFDNLYPGQEWGINLGFGADIMDVQVAYTWRRGLTDIFPESASKVFNSGHYFSMGYVF